MRTIDDIRDLSIQIADRLEDYADYSLLNYLEVQQTIFAEILRERALELYNTRSMFNSNDDTIIDEAIDVGILETDDILDDFKGYMAENSKYAYTMDFDEHYENGLTHLQNSQKFEMWLEQETLTYH